MSLEEETNKHLKKDGSCYTVNSKNIQQIAGICKTDNPEIISKVIQGIISPPQSR